MPARIRNGESSVAKDLEKFAKEYGFNMVKGLLYTANSPDLTSEAQALIAAKPDGMLFASYLSDSLLMIRTLKGMKALPVSSGDRMQVLRWLTSTRPLGPIPMES